jgi:hypothetical protein
MSAAWLMGLMLAGCAGPAGADADAGADGACAPEAQVLADPVNIERIAILAVLVDAAGPVVFWSVTGDPSLGASLGVYAARPGTPAVRLVAGANLTGLVAATTTLPNGGAGFLVCYNATGGYPFEQRCLTVDAALRAPSDPIDPGIGQLVYLARLEGQLVAVTWTPDTTRMSPPATLLQPLDEGGHPLGAAAPLDCPLNFNVLLLPAIAASSTRLACLSVNQGACGGEHGSPDCTVTLNVYDARGREVLSIPGQIPYGGWPPNQVTVVAREDGFLAAWGQLPDGSGTPPVSSVLPVAAASGQMMPGRVVTLPLSVGTVVPSGSGYAMVGVLQMMLEGAPSLREFAAVVRLAADGTPLAGPSWLVSPTVEAGSVDSPLAVAATADGGLAVAFENDYLTSPNSGAGRFVFRQVPGDLSGLVPVGSPLAPRACSSLARPPVGSAP